MMLWLSKGISGSCAGRVPDAIKICSASSFVPPVSFITLQLRPDHLGLSPGNLLHAKGEFLHGNLVLGFIPVAIHRRTGQLEDGLTHGLAGDRTRMNRNTSDHCGPVNYSDVLACLSRSDSRLLACGATANHDPSSAAAAKVFSQLKEMDGKWHMEGMAGNGPSGLRNPNRWHPGMRSQVTLGRILKIRHD